MRENRALNLLSEQWVIMYLPEIQIVAIEISPNPVKCHLLEKNRRLEGHKPFTLRLPILIKFQKEKFWQPQNCIHLFSVEPFKHYDFFSCTYKTCFKFLSISMLVHFIDAITNMESAEVLTEFLRYAFFYLP